MNHYFYPFYCFWDLIQGVLDSIADKEKWALEDFWVSELDVKKAKYKTVQRYDFRAHVGKIEVALKMHDETSEWKKLVGSRESELSNFEVLARKIGSTAVIDSFEVEGPLELMVVGEDDRLSLTLPVCLLSLSCLPSFRLYIFQLIWIF